MYKCIYLPNITDGVTVTFRKFTQSSKITVVFYSITCDALFPLVFAFFCKQLKMNTYLHTGT